MIKSSLFNFDFLTFFSFFPVPNMAPKRNFHKSNVSWLNNYKFNRIFEPVDDLKLLNDNRKLDKKLFKYEITQPMFYVPPEQFSHHLCLMKAFLLGKFSLIFFFFFILYPVFLLSKQTEKTKIKILKLFVLVFWNVFHPPVEFSR